METFKLGIPLQRKEKIFKTVEILVLDFFFQSCKIMRAPKQKLLGRDPYPLFKWKKIFDFWKRSFGFHGTPWVLLI